MAKLTLDQPLTLNPLQAAKLELIEARVDYVNRQVHALFHLTDANGAILEVRTATLAGAAVETWMANQEATLYQRLTLKLGVSGSLA